MYEIIKELTKSFKCERPVCGLVICIKDSVTNRLRARDRFRKSFGRKMSLLLDNILLEHLIGKYMLQMLSLELRVRDTDLK